MLDMISKAPEKAQLPSGAPEGGGHQIVVQPSRVEITDFLASLGSIMESVSDAKSGDWSSSGSMSGGAKHDDAKDPSPRDEAIAQLPQPRVMQKKLKQHIQTEVRKLHAQAIAAARINKPGAAYRLALLYRKIRQLNMLMEELIEAAYDIVRRMFIRVFIDKQPIQ